MVPPQLLSHHTAMPPDKLPKAYKWYLVLKVVERQPRTRDLDPGPLILSTIIAFRFIHLVSAKRSNETGVVIFKV